MKKQTLEARAESAAPPAAVWALLADVTTWSRWSSFDESHLESPGRDDPNGVGAIRRFRMKRRTTREEVVAFEPEVHLGYTLVAGLPVRDYRADVTLAPSANGGTEVRWRSSFHAAVPGTGWAAKVALQRFVQQVATALARAAEAASPSR
jgi:uncharacterized protein YndB with AHSA1/START domain